MIISWCINVYYKPLRPHILSDYTSITCFFGAHARLKYSTQCGNKWLDENQIIVLCMGWTIFLRVSFIHWGREIDDVLYNNQQWHGLDINIDGFTLLIQ